MGNSYGLIRRASPEALRSYFDGRRLTLPDDIDWTKNQPGIGKDIIAAIDQLSEDDRTRLNNDAERLTDMTDEPGQTALSDLVQGQPGFDLLVGAHDRAIWALLNSPTEFGHAEQSRYADEKRLKKMWDGWVAMPNLVLNRDEASMTAFKTSIREQFGTRHVHIDIFDRGRQNLDGSRLSLVQIVVYSEGQPTDDLAFGQQDELVRRSRRPVVEAAITYEPESGVLEVVARDRETREELLRGMASDLMGIEIEGTRLPFKKYRLEGLLRPHDFPTLSSDGIAGVDVRSLRLMPMDDQAERVILETSAKSTRNIWEMARSHFGTADPLAGGFVCTQARLSIKFHPAKGAVRGKVINLVITMPHSCNLGDHTVKEQIIGRKYLKEWNLLQDV